MSIKIKTATVELNDGAMCGLSDGAKMDAKSSIIEYVDNAEDENASLVSIKIDKENHTVIVLSKEETNLEEKDCGKLFNLGVGGKLHTKANGVGKYSQGFKYAGSALIGEGNKGQVCVAVCPVSGNKWGAIQTIDYTDDEKYTDKHILITDGSEIPDEYNFMVKVNGCKDISDNDIIKLGVELGIRYREKIEKGQTIIDINGAKVLPQDRLYSKFGKRVDYHSPCYLSWNGDEKAAIWEYSDTRMSQFNDTELIDYDTTLGLQGRQQGTAISCRSGVEVAINSVTTIYDKELFNLIGIQPQPSSSGFRGRLNILNTELADKYLKGGNKSCSTVNKSFSENEDTKEIREVIKDSYYNVIKRYHNDAIKNKKYCTIGSLDTYCENNHFDFRFKFLSADKNVEAFTYDNIDNIIIINENSSIMAPFKTDHAKCIFIISLLVTCKGQTIEDTCKRMKKFKNCLENDDII